MTKYFQFFIFCLLILFPFQMYGKQKPTVALVLSGGGAKGLAHISVLQTLDSLGIVPDLVIGTSMGSIVGGLYAMGYSGDSLVQLAKSTNWDQLLSNEIPLTDVGIEEKSEFNRYLLDVDFVEGKPKVRQSLINDQNLREFLSTLTAPSASITSFDDLPIPFRAIAADIVKGKEVALGEGSLYMAMRASMAIPTIFAPVDYDDMLLVDGSVLNNFPVDVAKRMGADFIIGSDVGGGMEPKENLDNMVTLLLQTGMLTSNLKNPANQKLCDILIDHLPNLSYSTGDFDKGYILYEEGKMATHKALDKFVALANQLEGKSQRSHYLPTYYEHFAFDTIAYKGISEGNLELLKSRTNIEATTQYSLFEVNSGIDRAMGTNLFDQISFKTYNTNGKLGIQFVGIERSPVVFKGALHYDNERGIGLVANITGRNVLGKASRSLITLDIAEEPGFRVQHQKYFGKQKQWWWRSEAFGERLSQQIYVNGNKADDLKHRFLQLDNTLNRNLHSLNSYIGFGVNAESTDLQPEVDPAIDDNILSLRKYNFQNLMLTMQFMHNTLDQVFYPTQGTYIRTVLDRSVVNRLDVAYTNDTLPAGQGSTEGFTRLAVEFKKRIYFQPRISGIVNASLGFTFVDGNGGGARELSLLSYGYGANYFVGGNQERPGYGNYTFKCLREAEVIASQFMMLNVGVQFNPAKSFYLTPHCNLASVGYGNFMDYMNEALSPNGNWSTEKKTSAVFSAGVLASYNSLLGPVEFDASWINDINKVRLSFSIGFHFNRSN